MKIAIIIPVHNEAPHIENMLSSIFDQTLKPSEVILVDDQSTDNSFDKINSLIEGRNNFKCIRSNANQVDHLPGPKVVKAFYQGYNRLEQNYDILCKFDGDIVLPPNYLNHIVALFQTNEKIGMAGGLMFIQKKSQWIYEPIASKNHLRGPIKAYRKACFDDIKGIKPVLGWDTIDVLQAQFHLWEVAIDTSLKVKHLKPTGTTYDGDSRFNLGYALFNMRTGWLLAVLSAAKLCVVRRQPGLFFNTILGFYKASRSNLPSILTLEEVQFIKKLRWKKLVNRLLY